MLQKVSEKKRGIELSRGKRVHLTDTVSIETFAHTKIIMLFPLMFITFADKRFI